MDSLKVPHSGAVKPWISYKPLWFLQQHFWVPWFPTWTLPLSAPDPPLGSFKAFKAGQHILLWSLGQKGLQYPQGLTWNNVRMWNVFWICVRALNHCLDGNFLELLDVRHRSWGCNKIWFHPGLQRKSNGQAPAASVSDRFKPPQWTGSVSTYTASSVRALRIHREKAIWLIRNFSLQESWKHLHPELLAVRVLTRNSTGVQAESWLFEHTVTSDSPQACCLQKKLLLRAENSLSA